MNPSDGTPPPSPPGKETPTGRRLSFAEVLAAELDAIDGGSPGRDTPLTEAALYQEIHARADRLPALCLSGGGIRSATFSLGVLQGLAKHRLLDQFKYLSTVSGGGYIGSWLTAWLRRRAEAEPDVDPYQRVMDELAGRRLPVGDEGAVVGEARPVERLRQFSSYLAPERGLLSADLWAVIATMLRNVILNWLVLVPMLIAVLAVPRLVASMATAVDARAAAGVAFLSCAWAVAYVSRQRTLKMGLRASQGEILLLGLAPICAAALFVSAAWAQAHLVGADSAALTFDVHLTECLLFGVGVLMSGWIGYRASVLVRPAPIEPNLLPHTPANSVWELLIYVATGIVGAFLLRLCALPFDYQGFAENDRAVLAYASIAPSVFFLAFTLSATLFTGLASHYMSEQDREWGARFGAWQLIAGTVWTGVSLIVLLLPHWLADAYRLAVAAVAVAGSGGLTVLAGMSGRSVLTTLSSSTPPVDASQDAPTGRGRGSWLSFAVKVALPTFVVLFMVLLSLITDVFVEIWGKGEFALDAATRHYFSGGHLQLARSPDNLWIALLAVGAAFLASRFIGINEFSLHAMYRNRLIRAYLAASRGSERRTPDKFIGFDPGDDFELCHSAPAQTPARKGRSLLHVINMALNLVSGDELAWQERKAESMTATSLHVGSPGKSLGYRFSREYGGVGKEFGGTGHSMTLGTAMAISGAAASPNMGYHSSPTVTFLLTLFNARLGWWLGNPGRHGDRTYMDESPKDALRPLLAEAFGRTDRTHPYVYVSDGGHFENLGIYEMVRRRAGVIVAIDAGADPECSFDDLSAAVRKVRSDFGIPIEIPPHDKRFIFRRSGPASRGGGVAMIGTIHYEAVDASARPGTLLYIKPAFYNQLEPIDVVNYAATHVDFPHEPTADQFFTESQFESYRALGLFAVESLCQFMPDGQSGVPEFLDSARLYVGRLGPSSA